MRATQRRAAAAVGFLALPMLGVPAFAQDVPQRGGKPDEKTPYILVTTFQSPDGKLGVESADQLRRRLQSEHSAKDLYVITKRYISATLSASGYRPDSALGSMDLMELAKQLRGRYVIDGKAIPAPGGKGVRFQTRILLRTGQNTLSQPLPPVDGGDPGDAAKATEKLISQALESMPKYDACIADLRAQKYDQARTDAQAAITAYANAVPARICLLQALTALKAPPDSVISVANAILGVDSTSQIALANLVEAYRAKGDNQKVVETDLRIWKLDRTNQTIAQTLVADLAKSGAPELAIPIIDTLLAQNPMDAQLVHTKWVVQLSARRFKDALATGAQLIKLDTSAANLDFYQRQIGAAQSDSNAAEVQEWATRAAERFPTDVTFPMLLAQSYRKSGDTLKAYQYARRATEVDPKNGVAWLFALVGATQLHMADTAMSLARQGVAAGAPRDTIGQALVTLVSPSFKRADSTKARADWEAVLTISQAVDSIAPSTTSKFFVGYSAFSVGIDALQNAQKLAQTKGKDAKEAKARACAEVNLAEELWATAQINILPGAGFNKDAAGAVMGAIQQNADVVPQMKKAYCGK